MAKYKSLNAQYPLLHILLAKKLHIYLVLTKGLGHSGMNIIGKEEIDKYLPLGFFMFHESGRDW